MRIAKYICAIIIIISLLTVATGCYFSARMYSDIVAEISQIHDVDPALALAICQAESGFNTSAVSRAGAVGIMQLLPSTAEWICALRKIEYSEDALYTAEYNIDLGVWYLNYLTYFDDRDWQIAAYNAGEGVVNKWIKEGITIQTIPYDETKNYVEKVNRYYNIFKKRNII